MEITAYFLNYSNSPKFKLYWKERETDRQNKRKVSVIKPHKLHIRDIPVE